MNVQSRGFYYYTTTKTSEPYETTFPALILHRSGDLKSIADAERAQSPLCGPVRRLHGELQVKTQARSMEVERGTVAGRARNCGKRIFAYPVRGPDFNLGMVTI